MTASNLPGRPCDRDYLLEFPLERIREIHVAGPRPIENSARLRDAHMEMRDEDYDLLRYDLDEAGAQARNGEHYMAIGSTRRNFRLYRNYLPAILQRHSRCVDGNRLY